MPKTVYFVNMVFISYLFHSESTNKTFFVCLMSLFQKKKMFVSTQAAFLQNTFLFLLEKILGVHPTSGSMSFLLFMINLDAEYVIL